MPISKDLFLAILSLDSYNRGYGAGLSDGSGNVDADGNDIDGLGEAGAKVGNTSVKAVELPAGSEAAGFYAISYSVGAGAWEGLNEDTTVISYRGTDVSDDYWRGWTISLGLTDIFTQTDETLAFYTAVTGKNYWEGAAPNTIVTGHSLGGGLAGVVSALTGTEGYGLDHMPFGLSAALQNFRDDVDGPPLNFTNISSAWTENEILQSAREGSLQANVGTVLAIVTTLFGAPLAAGFLASLGAVQGGFAAYYESLIPVGQKQSLESYSGISGFELIDRALRLHMVDYLVQLQFAKELPKNYGDSALNYST